MRAVVVRSTDCLADSRVNRIITVLNDIGLSVNVLAWDRDNGSTALPTKQHEYFRESAQFGQGILNTPHQLKFQKFVRSKLVKLQPDFVYACDLDGALPVAMFCNRHHTPWVFDQFDQFGDRLQLRMARIPMARLEARVARRATVRIVASPERRTGAFTDAFVVRNVPSETISTNAWELSRTLYYGGVLQEDRGLRTAVAALKFIPNWSLRIAGYGPIGGWIRKQAQLTENLYFLGQQTHEQVLSEMSQATAVLAMYDPEVPNNLLTASNKLGEAALVRRPLITSQGTGIDRSAKQAGFGFSTIYGSVGSFLLAIRDIKSAFDHSVDVAAGCANYEEQHGWLRQRKQLLAALNAAGVISA